MSSTKDLVIKMTINSTDFDNGLKNARSSMMKMENSAGIAAKSIKAMVGGMAKSFTALGLAVGGTEMFKSFVSSTQTLGDAWNNAMVTAKTSFQVLETAVATGSSTILANFRQSISAAREFAEAMDALGSAQISSQYARMSYVTPFNEEMTKYRAAKQQGDTTGMAFAASNMKRYLAAYEENSKNVLTASRDAIGAKLASYTAGYVNKSNLNQYLDQLYLEIINGVFPPILTDFRTLDKELEKGDYFYNKAKEEMAQRYGPGWRKEAEALNVLANINDETLNGMLEVIKTYDGVRNEINGMRRQMNKTLNGEGTVKLTPTTTPTTESKGLSIDQLTEYYTRMVTSGVFSPQEKIIPLEDLIQYDDIIEEDTDALVESLKARREAMEKLALQTADAIEMFSALGNVFNQIGNLSGDNMFGNIASAMGGIVSQANSTISAMMALAKAETIEGIAEVFSSTPGLTFTKVALTATALAGVLSVISTAKNAFAGSFAEGGVVGGNSYTGDKLLARVNSGELIVPYDVWHRNASEPDDSWSRIASLVAAARTSFAGSFAEGGVVGGNSYTGDKLLARVNSGELIVPYDVWHRNASEPEDSWSRFASIFAEARTTFAGSFADGGVVGGNIYSGDKMLARVNSGELIVPYDDWHNGSRGGNVKFIIEGSQLKGVLENYESLQNM